MAPRSSDRDTRARSGSRAAGTRTGARNPFEPRRPVGSRRTSGGLAVAGRARRHRLGLLFLVVLLVAVVVRLVVLQGLDGAAYAQAAEDDRLRTFDIAAVRGSVTDVDGNLLAYSVQASRVVADPTIIEDTAGAAQALAPLLDVPEPELAALLEEDGRYVVLAAQVDTATTDRITELELPGIVFEDDPVRLYPAGAVGGQIIGFVGRDGDGLAGIEQTQQDVLAGTDGARRVEVGAGGVPIPAGIDDSTAAVDGGTVRLTIDEDLQYVVQQRLDAECAAGETTRGSAVALHVATGEIAAMASCPGYDPSQARTTDPGLLGNPVVSDVFEPGSVLKAVTLAAAIEDGHTTPGSVLEVPDRIQAGDAVVADAHSHDPVDWTVTGILAKSSNVGTIMLAREVGDERLEGYLRAFGLGERTGVELPGESAGILEGSADWTESRAANVPIGQGVSVTALQMASVYQAIANDGVRIAPRVVDAVTAADGTVTDTPRPEGTRVISPETADAMAYMLEAVVGTGGTAPLGAVDGFRVAGKTGTAQRANPETGGYAGGGYTTTFVGFAPADDPQYVIAVDLERPNSDAEGGQVAAPVFADLMRYALTSSGVVPSGTERPEFQLTGPTDDAPTD